jgi:glyoxylase-like metal-dependent hydrolase (beta-lactamase superfamily II)
MRVELIPAGNPGPYTGAGNATWLVEGPQSLLVDAGAGQASHADALAEALARDAAVLATVVVTHAHIDHMGGAALIASRWPVARFLKMPWADRDGRYAVTCEPLSDGDRVSAGDDELVAVHTPGHSPDHIVLWHEPTRSLFSGDLLIEGGTVVIPASRGGSGAASIGSLQRMLALDPARAYPAHGPIIERPAALIRGYLAHRARREAQVLEALEAGAATPQEIASRVYAAVPDPLRGAAEESVLAHLVKLEDEGRAVCDEGRFRAT